MLNEQLIQISLAVTAIVVGFFTLLTMIFLLVEFLKYRNKTANSMQGVSCYNSLVSLPVNSRDVECSSLFVGYENEVHNVTFENPGYGENTLIDIDPESFIFKSILFKQDKSLLDVTIDV